MYYYRKLIQYNDLLFEDVLTFSNGNSKTKYKTQDYTYKSGSYLPIKSVYNIYDTQEVSITFRIHIKGLSCEDKEKYINFAIQELSRKGKLWSIRNNRVEWAEAIVVDYTESTSNFKDFIEISVSFLLYEGYWHIANNDTVYGVKYNLCNNMVCKPTFEYQGNCSKNGSSCCSCAEEEEADVKDCCCASCSSDSRICLEDIDLQSFYKDCKHKYKFNINCNTTDAGTKLCKTDSCSTSINGFIYNQGTIPTNEYVIQIKGSENPTVQVGNTINQYIGDYSGGTLLIYGNGVVEYVEDSCNNCKTVLSLEKVNVIKGSYGFTFYPGKNFFKANTSDGSFSCAYIWLDEKTI